MTKMPYTLQTTQKANMTCKAYMLLALFLLLTALPASAQITIGGNVYGGGNEGDTEGNTNVTIRTGQIKNVYGGARMAEVKGRAFVNIDGENGSGMILISAVYGGNDISGTVGTGLSDTDTGTNKLPTELTEVLGVGTSPNDTQTSKKNAIDNTWSAVIRTSPMKDNNGDLKEYINSETDANCILVGSIYGGGNGDYTYTDANGDPLQDSNGKYIAKSGDEVIATSSEPFSAPTIKKTYLEINGGCLSQVYGGGNNATVTMNTTISMNNPSKGLQSLFPSSTSSATLMNVLARLSSYTGISTFQGDYTSLDYTSSRVFGGNNKAEMRIRPVWNLQRGKLRDVYSGGNEGNMTHPDGLLLDINPLAANSNFLSIVNVYGGCRRADVRPTIYDGNNVSYPTNAQLPNELGYHFPAGLPARTVVRGGKVTNVYGGNDISGRVFGGNAVGIYTTVYGDVYGGGNGSYAYTDNPALGALPGFRDFYYNPDEVEAKEQQYSGDNTFTLNSTYKSVEALNIFRPNAEQVSILVRGTETNPTIIRGSVYLGGNSASLKTENTTVQAGQDPKVELKIGSYSLIDKVFLGNNGANMVTEDILHRYAKYVSTTTGATEDSGTDDNDYSQLTLTDPTTFAKYMEGCAMSIKPSVVFENTEYGDPQNYIQYSSQIGSFFCGGNRGSMTWPGNNTINFNKKVIIFDKFVGGCNDANIAKTTYNAEYLGGMIGSPAEQEPNGMLVDPTNPNSAIKDCMTINFTGLKIQPKRWVQDANGDVLDTNGNPQLEWNTFDYTTNDNVSTPTTTGPITRTGNPEDFNRRLRGGNIYGGCYNSGHMNGNVIINIIDDIVDLTGDYAVFDIVTKADPLLYNNDEYTITKRNSGVILDEQGMDPLGLAMNVFGGGYGPGSEVWGSATVNLRAGHTFQIFGGGQQGPIGKSLEDNGVSSFAGSDYVFNGKHYKYDARYSTYVNMEDDDHVAANDKGDNFPETQFIYGGSFEAPIMGNTHVYLGNGRAFNSFAGSCNADILGHTETYVGKSINRDGSATDGQIIESFPYIIDHIYGGNDLGGKILGEIRAEQFSSAADAQQALADCNFTARLTANGQDLSKVYKDSQYDATNNNSKLSVLTASAYIEYTAGHVVNIFGGAYGDYDYTDPKYRAYCDENGANIGDFSKPRLGNAFVNFKPAVSSNDLTSVTEIYGAGQGRHAVIDRDVMQERSYILVDIPQTMTEFNNTVFFGAGAYGGLGMEKTPDDALDKPDKVSAIIDLVRGNISGGNVYGGSYKEGVTRRTVVNVPTGSTISVKNIFGGAYGVDLRYPCDVYEAIVNYGSDDAQMSGNIYGGNNNARRTLYGKVNISSPVWTNKTNGYTATVYGAGYGENTWSQYTEVNLLNGASVYEVYGGGQAGKVMNLESVNKWKAEDNTIDFTLSQAATTTPYTDLGLDSDVANYSQLEIDRAAEIINIEDSWKNKGTTYTKKKYNTNVSIKEGATVDGYCYGGGLGYNTTPTSGDVYGTTYIDLLGGTVKKDLYAAGTTGAVMDGKKVGGNFVASANAYIKGGTVRNCYGGGWEGPVGYHDESTTATTNDILGETHVVIGVLGGPCAPAPALTFLSGVPTVQRNAYGGGEGGVVYGTTNITLNNGYIGYVYNASGSDNAETEGVDEHYEQKIADETYDDGNGAGNNQRLIQAGNLFGSGYADNSNADFTHVYLYGGVVRNSAYGGGEIGTVGRGANSSGTVNVHKAGEAHVYMYQGKVLQDVFGGGRGFDNLNRVSAIGTGGYVFGKTDVNIYGGEIGTTAGVAEGYGNVFGGGNLGYVYSGNGTKKNDADGYYYDINNTLTEDCRVIVAPACQVKCGEESISLNNHSYTAGQYVPAEDLNFLKNKNNDEAKWAKLNIDGVVIRNAVFAGGNVSSGSDQVYANTVTVYGNATATLYDIYNRDLITIGTEHVGGLYGDGNLTFVDGYRELNVSNYGTDYYGMSDNISYEDYKKLSDRERAYFQLEYKCISGYTSGETSLNRTVNAGERISEEEFNKMDATEQAHWELGGFCTIYAGRLLNTLQRADFVGVFGSRMVLQGAQDRVPEVVDYNNYTINRVGELSLNKCNTQAGDSGKDAEHGCYFGIYSIVNYLGALTSDVDFTAVRTTDNSESQYTPDSEGQTYQQWKEAHATERKRNNGTCHNKVALASGVYLELTNESTEKRTDGGKDWGPITGVCQLDLISVMKGLGGGYVYAKNEHGTRQSSGNNHTILSPYNMDGYGHAKAVTNKIYTYNSTLKPYETSGNFIHNTKQIIDDCYPTGGSYSGTDAAPAHYWYIKGEIYVYDQVISAYTGSANAYAESINLPLTITPGSNGTLKLTDVKENLYAYYDETTTGSQTKIGENGILIGTTLYHLNDPITYWDWNLLSAEDNKHLVTETYTVVEKCKIGDKVYNVGDAMLSTEVPSSTAEALVWVGSDTEGEYKAVDGKDVNYLVRLTNNVAHNTGYALTYDMTNPKVWDRYYTPPTGASVSGKVTTAVYEPLKSTTYKDYVGAPTYTPTTSGVYGQRDYAVGDIIPNDIHATYTAIGSGTNSHSYPSGQATVVQAYVATAEATYTIGTTEHHVYKGYAISATEYEQLDASTKAKFATANVCTSTIELGNNEYVYYGDLLTDEEINGTEGYKAKYRAFLESQGISAADAATKADADFAASVSNAWYCITAGKYGGDWYEAAKNYRALEAWSAMSETDRANFTFNYDAFDALIDPQFAGITARYDGPNNNTPTLQALYSALTPVDYKATYNGTSVNDTALLTYTDEHGNVSPGIAVGSTIDREAFEDIPNEKRYYQAITIDTPGTYYFVKVGFSRGDNPYTVGTKISENDFNSLDDNQKQNVMTQTFTAAQVAATHDYYFCRKPYKVNEKGEGVSVTDIGGDTYTSGDEVTVGTIITKGVFETLPNKQTHFTIHGDVPVGTSTLYVSRESDINDLSEEKVITVIYDYTYEESDESGTHVDEITEKHVINIHLQFKSGVPAISELEKPAIVLPNSTVGLKQPNVTPGAFEIIGGGWEMFTNQSDAEHHTNGIPYFNNLTPMYWYQNDYYVAYYAKSYLGKTYSNAVQFTVANYHDIDAVMNHPRHLFVDHEDVSRPCTIYIDNRECTDKNVGKSELDLLKDFYDLTLQNEMDADGNPKTISGTGTAADGHLTVDDHIRGGANLDFILKSDVAPKAYTNWTPIGDGTKCFEGVFHGNGYTISGLNNSLFGSLCGDVYNLGVTGSFTSAGIVDNGSGYVENCWVSTTKTPASDVHAVFNTPNRDQYMPVANGTTLTAGVTYYTSNTGDGVFEANGNEVADGTNYYTKSSIVQVVNCYYPADNAYTETPHTGNHGDAIKKPRQSFYNGEVAYDLNGFYLNKRYNDHLATRPTGYSADNKPEHPYYYYWDADDLDSNNKPRLKKGGYEAETDYTLGYVEEYYKDGDFIYAGGYIPENDNERYSTTDAKHYPIWPDDYIFFGQMLTYGHVDSRPHQDKPAHINKSGDRLTTSESSVNRVYRAPAYFQSKQMGVAYYNPYAVFAAKSKDETHTAYPNMTAIDFTGGNGDLAGGYKKGLVTMTSGAANGTQQFYPPLIDNDGLTFFRNVDLTRNLLAYTPNTDGNSNHAQTKTHTAVMAALKEPAYAEGNATGTGYVPGKDVYRTVAGQDVSVIHGHAVVETAANTYTATNDHLLVDKEDFNAPISYTFNSDKRMWYQRRPDSYVDLTKGWEGISIPFSAEVVTTQQKGEITHFYSGSQKSDKGTPLGHEYWLREYNGNLQQAKDANNNVIPNTYTAEFNYPAAITGGDDKNFTNTFLYDYYYRESGSARPDDNTDTYQQRYYASSHTYEDYAYSAAAKPYIIGFPGTTYYEFDLSGGFTAANALHDITPLAKQVITFASPQGTTIAVSDDELTNGKVTKGDDTNGYYSFMPNYMSKSVDPGAFTLSSNGSSYDKQADAVTPVPFRPYFTFSATNQVKETRSIVFNSLNTQFGGEADPGQGEATNEGLLVSAKRKHIYVTSAYNSEVKVTIVNTAGAVINTFSLQPGETMETQVASGVYLVNKIKIAVK